MPERKYVAVEGVKLHVSPDNKIMDVDAVKDFLENTEMATLNSFEKVFGRCSIGRAPLLSNGYINVYSDTSVSLGDAYYEIESTELGGLFIKIKTEKLKLETPEDSETGEDLDYEEPEVIVEVAIVDAFGERKIIFRRDYSAETGTGAETVD